MVYHSGASGTVEAFAHDRRRGRRYSLLRGRIVSLPPEIEQEPSAAASPELEAMRSVDPFTETLLFRVFVEGTSYHQLGREQGVPASTIKRRIDRRIETLRATLQKRLRREGRDGDQEDTDGDIAGAGVRLKPKPSDWDGRAAIA